MAESYCFQKNNDFEAEESGINELQCCQRKLEEKQSKLNNEFSEKNDLKRQLLDTSNFIDNIIKKHESVHSQLSSNYDVLWCKYQSKSKELNQSKSEKECLIDDIEELNNKSEKLKCSLKMQNEKNKCLEEENDKLERCLYEERENVKFLKCENQNQMKCLDKKSDDLCKITEKLNEKTDELNNEKRENRRVEHKKEELCRKFEKLNLEQSKLKNSKEALKLELNVKLKQNVELGQVICDQKCQLQELKDMLQKCNQKNDELKHLREKEKIEANCCIEKIRNEKLCVENQRQELECMLQKRTEELKKLEQNYERLVCHNKDLQCKLDTVVKNNDEQKQCTNVQIEKMNCDIRQLQADVCAKDTFIKELEERLCNEKNLHKAEIECSQKLRLKFESLKLRQKATPPKYDQCKSSKCNDYQLTDTVSKVLEELNLNCQASTVMSSNYDDIADGCTDDKGFEKLCSKLDSIVNYMNK